MLNVGRHITDNRFFRYLRLTVKACHVHWDKEKWSHNVNYETVRSMLAFKHVNKY